MILEETSWRYAVVSTGAVVVGSSSCVEVERSARERDPAAEGREELWSATKWESSCCTRNWAF
jgi:hypothetical protein